MNNVAKTPGRQASTAPPKGPDKISLAKLPPEAARKSFKALLLSNPNYFGNLKESEFQPVLNIAGDTAYENIGCVGFNPQLNRLEAVVYINQATGYDGDVCSGGSQEFVRFYLSYDGGATCQDLSLWNTTLPFRSVRLRNFAFFRTYPWRGLFYPGTPRPQPAAQTGRRCGATSWMLRFRLQDSRSSC